MKTELDRVHEDLDLIKATLGNEFPYDVRHVAMNLIVAGGGVIVALSAAPGWQSPMRGAVVAYFVAVVAIWLWQIGQFHSERTVRPKAWRWTKRETWSVLVGVALLIPYVLSVRFLADQRNEYGFEQWRDLIASPAIFCVGVAISAACISTPERLSWLAWGVIAALGGLAIPWCQSSGQVRLLLGFVLIIGGMASAAILYRQIRQAERNDGGN